MCILSITSCASTQKAWSKFEPSEYAYVESNGSDPEPMLIKNELHYYCTEVKYSSDNLNKACYVEKSLAQQSKEFSTALLKTPEALVKDMVVVGKITIQALYTIGAIR